MSLRSANFATPPVLTQDSQGPQTAQPLHPAPGPSIPVHRSGDMRANMNVFGKTRPLTVDDFKPFEKCFGDDPHGKAKRKDQGEEGRFRFYSREQIAAKGDNLDLSWLRDTSNDPEDEMTEPDELAAAIIGHLKAALEEVDAFSEEIAQP